NATTREATRLEVATLLDSAIQIGNTNIDGTYLFGGAHSLDRPFAADGSITPDRAPVGDTHVEIGTGNSAALNHDGQTVLVESYVSMLSASDAVSIGASAADIKAAFEAVQGEMGEDGARANRIDIAESNIEALELNLKTLRSSVADEDLETALTDLVNRQTTL